MRALNRIGIIGVLLIVLAVSYYYSILLLYSLGVTGWVAYVIAAGVEIIFTFGVLSFVTYRVESRSEKQ